MAYYLGIDGGGSKTTCAVGDESSLLTSITTGPSNITRVGDARAREALHQAIREACAAARIDPRQVQRVCLGAAGAGRSEVAEVFRKIAAELIPGEIEVVGDMEIAMTAAFGRGAGVIVIAGTGSIAYGRNARGETARAGGWGFAISDEGSAHWIGRSAVSHLLRAIDEANIHEADPQAAADALPLFRELAKAWKVHSLAEFVRTANSAPDFALLFPVILEAGEVGDKSKNKDGLVETVLRQAGRELAQLARIVARRLFAENKTAPAEIPLAMAGGVLRHSRVVGEVFCAEVRRLDARLKVNTQIVDPVMGALQIARQAVSPTARP